VLSEDELRATVLANLVNHEIIRTIRYNSYHSKNEMVGINSPTQETNIQKLVEVSYNNENSFEENFGLKLLVNGHERRRRKYDPLKEYIVSPGQISELFLSRFSPKRRREASIIISSNLKLLTFSNLTPEQRKAAKKKRLCTINCSDMGIIMLTIVLSMEFIPNVVIIEIQTMRSI